MNFPWPEPSNPVRDGAAAIRALAESVNNKMRDQLGNMRIEARRITIDPNSFGNAVITFAKPFTNLPVVTFAVWGDENTGRWATFGGSQITTTYVGTFLYNQLGARITSTVQMMYIAIGQDNTT
jgi:hypothetical protein